MATKELVVVSSDKSPQLFKIKYAGGGQLPEKLEGQYTSYHTASAAIRNYILTKPKRKTNGPVKSRT